MSRYERSEKMLDRALRTIPLGTQTFSKSHTQYPRGVSPLFVERGDGSRIWDVDGNEYIDYSNSLAAVTLGYSDPDVTEAVNRQLARGVTFTLPHPAEIACAERIVDMVPCAEMVRFGKNGSDATAGAVRLARAYTGRNRIMVCGYHGWQDWYIGSTSRDRGVPRAVSDLTHPVPYNDLDAVLDLFRSHPGEFAALILEPMNLVWPRPGYLNELKELVHAEGALLVFDEVVTGFRFAPGGAQELFDVTPDLATLGKGLANGFPLSAVVGRADLMRLMEEVFFSFTMGGETLSLAAAIATMDKVREHGVPARLAKLGKLVLSGLESMIVKHELRDVVSVAGHPSWSFLVLSDFGGYSSFEIKTLFLQEMFARGILTTGSHNVTFSHSEADIAQLLEVYDEVLPLLSSAIKERRLREALGCQPLQPLFKVR